MASAPKYISATSGLFACLQNAEGVPEAVSITFARGEGSIVWSRDSGTFAYDCIVEGCTVRVLEEAIGEQSVVQSMVQHMRDPQCPPELRLARSGLARIPQANAPPLREGIAGGAAPASSHGQMGPGAGDRGVLSAEADVPCPMQVCMER
jgi:hypothetical protein